jgi:hypothetical protein
MLGQHKLLEQKLRHKGTAALATVVEVLSRHTQHQSNDLGQGRDSSLVKVRLRVEPEGEPAFEVTTDAWLPGTEGTSEGMMVPVLYDPKDHDKLVIDQREEAWGPAVRANTQLRMQAHRAEKAQGPVPIPSSAYGLPSTGALSKPDPIDQLTRLADLHDRGALTDEEFDAQKRRLLGD